MKYTLSQEGEALGWFGMELFLDLRQGSVREVLREEGQQGAAKQCEVGQEVGLAAAGAVFAQEDVPSPVVADFHAAPVAANEGEPLLRLILFRVGAGKVIVRLGGSQAGLFDGALVAQDDHGVGSGEVRRQRFDGEGMDLAGFDAAMGGVGPGKKGGFWSASRPWACFNRRGWLPLI